MESILYTVEEASKLLKCNADTVYRLCRSGILPYLKLGRYKIRKVALEDFIAKYEGYDVTDPENVIKISEQEGTMV